MTELVDRLAAAVQESALAGGVAATSDDGVRVVAATGVLDRVSGEAMTVSTPVRIASVTKPMVAAAVVLAAREVPGLLDRPVIDDLPDLRPDWRVSPELTLRRLLSQTSGLGEEIDRELLEALGDGPDAQLGAARMAVARSQVAPVGTTWSYYNPNYSLAGAVLARVRDTSFEEALDELVLRPAGMTATGFEQPAGAAYGHMRGEQVSQDFLYAVRPAGGLWSTVDDLMSFAEFVLADPELLATVRVPLTDPQGERQYGLGWFLDGEMIYHPGGARGFESILAIEPERRHATAVVVNEDTEQRRPKVFTDLIGEIA